MKLGRAPFHYAAVVAGVDSPETQTAEAERALLVAFLKGQKRIVEIGVYEGFTTQILLTHSDSDAVVYGVDPFLRGKVGVCWSLKIAQFHNRSFLKSGKLRLVRSYSTQVGNYVPSSVDYVFLDGDHSLEGIKADWDFWSSRLSRGGIIALHDVFVTPSTSTKFGSHDYFQRHIGCDSRFVIVGKQDSLAVLRKR